jgi:uncharacterized protein
MFKDYPYNQMEVESAVASENEVEKRNLTLQKRTNSPYAKLQPIQNHQVHWTDGFWAEWSRICRDSMVPNMWRLLADDGISHAYANFRIAAGQESGEHRGPKWQDGDFYKWLEAASSVYDITHEAELNLLMDQIIEVIAQGQREDGYIHTPVMIAARHSVNGEQEFNDRLHFETYNMGHLMTAACVHYEATGKTSLLQIARKAVDYLYHFYQTAAPELARNAICPSHYIGVVDMYRTTGDPRYLELARNLIEIRSLVQGGDDNQDRIPFREQEHIVGHAVRANYLYAGIADVFAETGDDTLLAAVEKMWQSLTSYKMYITGGCGALYDGASPDGSENQSQITRVHQAYGRDYQLPNVTAHSETCANIGNLMWNWRMLNITGDARYAEVMELALYNSVLSGISLDGKRFFYTNPLRKVDDLPFELRWSKTREPYISCFCCPPNVVRTIAQVGQYAYSVAENGIWIHFYGGSSADLELAGGIKVNLIQKTLYPFEGDITIMVDVSSPATFAIMLRIPGWTAKAELLINNSPFTGDLEPGAYLKIEREWISGDGLSLKLDMTPQMIEAHPLVEEISNHLAIKRGPIVYCVEAVDLPAHARINSLYLSPDIMLTAASDARLERMLPGIRVLRGNAYLDNGSFEAWQGHLYRPVQPRKLKEIEVTFVPYFAWDNRGDSEMIVWIPALR